MTHSATAVLLHVRHRPFTVEEYNKMAETGILAEAERVELIEGAIVPLAAHNPEHSDAITCANEILVHAFSPTHRVRVQVPLEINDLSEPEPDLAVVAREAGPGARRHPREACLVIEVANTSLAYDRTEKASLYASAGVPEYWILNVRDRKLELHLDPAPDPRGTFGFAYQTVRVLEPDQTVIARFLPPVAILVADLLA